jgi:hypothetical protein
LFRGVALLELFQ